MNCTADKRGLAKLVPVAFIIVVSVGLVVTLWIGVQPFFYDSTDYEIPFAQFTIDTKESYTIYDPEDGYLSVRVRRGKDDAPVVALKFIVDINGDSKSFVSYNYVPPNHAQVFYFELTPDSEINSVKVVPIFYVNYEEVEGDVFDVMTKVPIQYGYFDQFDPETIPFVKEEGAEDEEEEEEGEGDDILFEENLIVYYTFDEGSYNVLNPYQDGPDWVVAHLSDVSGNGHLGKVFNMNEYEFEGKVNNAFYFDANSDFIEITNAEPLKSFEKTFSAWLIPVCDGQPYNLLDTAPSQIIVSFDRCSGSFGVDEVEVYSNTVSGLESTPFYFDAMGTEWHHFVIVYADVGFGEVHLYIDGELIGTQSLSNQQIDGTFDKYYLADPVTSEYKGFMDEVRIYDRALSGAEVLALYNTYS